MLVLKRDGRSQEFSFDKLLMRLRRAGHGLSIPFALLLEQVGDQHYSGITTTELDELVAQQCASKCTTHPDYGSLAARISVSSLHKRTPSTFFEAMRSTRTLLHENTWRIIERHRIALSQATFAQVELAQGGVIVAQSLENAHPVAAFAPRHTAFAFARGVTHSCTRGWAAWAIAA